MRALTPSLHVRPVEKAYDIEQKVLYGKDEYVTPVPESVCEPGMLQSCQKYIQKVGDILGLSGVAQVDAFLNCRSGEVGIVDVNTSPYLGPHSPLLQQVTDISSLYILNFSFALLPGNHSLDGLSEFVSIGRPLNHYHRMS